ncbi:MAG: AAA family ATPase [Gammaproteobacteria bacterium]|nr:AAA family ATPase [Gammaproteobacteria bacterium]
MAEATQTDTFDINKEQVSLKNLYLDPNNYRLIHEGDYKPTAEEKINDKAVQRRTFRLLAGDKNQHIQGLLESFKANGYLPADQIQVRPLVNGGYVVVEGNRRVATLKHLQREYEDRDAELGKLDPVIFSKVPVVLYADSDEVHHLTLMALKHISGNKKWGEWNQAKLLEKLYSAYNLSEEEICKRIEISKVELRRSLRALSFLTQYEESDYGDQFSGAMFPLFSEVVRNAALKDWLEWEDDIYKAANLPNCDLFFSWISREPLEREDEQGSVPYGEDYREPALVKRSDVALLGKIINDDKAIEKLKQTRDINAAYRSSNQIFRERQQAAVTSINDEIDTLAQMTTQDEHIPLLESSLGRLQTIVDRARTSSSLAGVTGETVFHERLDAHFSLLRIEDYKRLKNLEISKLSRINLFAGINNSGKTSVLEAIYLLCHQNDFSGLLEVIRRRGKLTEDRLNSEWLLEQLPQNISLRGNFDKCDATVRASPYTEENGEIDKSRYLKSVEIKADFGESKQKSRTRIFKDRDRETQAGSMKILCPSVFSSPFFLNESHRYAAFYHKSTQSKALPKIFRFIREKVIPGIQDIRLVAEWQRFLVTDEQYEYAPDLTEYGEGLQRIFFVSLLFASAQNGVVLIDEFENAIHTGLIGHFAVFIADLAELFNTQVFLTSHSKECIDAFVRHVPDEQLCVCSLVEDGNRIAAREFSGTEFKRLLEAGNVDIRRAK